MAQSFPKEGVDYALKIECDYGQQDMIFASSTGDATGHAQLEPIGNTDQDQLSETDDTSKENSDADPLTSNTDEENSDVDSQESGTKDKDSDAEVSLVVPSIHFGSKD